MAALVTPYSVGNQAAMIRRAFSPQSMAGLGWLGNTSLLQAAGDIPAPVIGYNQYNQKGSGITSKIIDAASQFVQSRWGEQRGTIVYDPVTGQVKQKQAGDYPIDTRAPLMGAGQLQTTDGLGTGMAVGTMVMVGIGALVLVMVMSGGRRR